MPNFQLIIYTFLGLLFFSQFLPSKKPNLNHVPSADRSGWLPSYVVALRYLLQSWKVTQEGYRKVRNGVFKVPFKGGWMVFCCGHQLADEIRRAKEDQLSLFEAIDEVAHMKVTLGEETFADPYHINVMRSALTKNIAARFPDMRDEMVQAFQDALALDGSDWKAVPAMDAILSVVSRISNRVFVGLPLCRNADYLKLVVGFTADVMKTAYFIDLFPKFMRKKIGGYLTKLPYYVERLSPHLAPLLAERLRMRAEYNNDWPDEPNDYISWLLRAVDGSKRSTRDLILRILSINFAAIHTSSLAFTHVLYDLAANTEYIPSLREEAESIIQEYGWTKEGIDRMIKVDSFLRESQRIHGIASMIMSRKVVRDFTFSDGTSLPAGTILSLPMYATHRDEANYSSPDVFDPYRFARLREGCEDKDRRAKYQMVASGTENLTWGLGRHVCPGRYFAAVELKAMLAHIVLSYDIKFAKDGERPRDLWLASACVPNRTAKVLFRKRSE